MAPKPPSFGAPRRTRGAPLVRARLGGAIAREAGRCHPTRRRSDLPSLLVDPGHHQATPVVVPDVGPEVLHIGFPGGYSADRGAVVVVDLFGEVALDVVEDLAPLGDVERASLQAN